MRNLEITQYNPLYDYHILVISQIRNQITFNHVFEKNDESQF